MADILLAAELENEMEAMEHREHEFIVITDRRALQEGLDKAYHGTLEAEVEETFQDRKLTLRKKRSQTSSLKRRQKLWAPFRGKRRRLRQGPER